MKVQDLWVKNIYFPCHTLTNSRSNSWNGKSTVRTLCTMNFRSVLECCEIFFYGLIISSTYFCTSLPTYLVFKFYNKYYTIIMVHFSLIILTKRYFGKFSIIIRSNKAKMAQEALSSGLRIISEAYLLDNN